MKEFILFFNEQQVPIPLLLFLMAFSCGIALFHTLIIAGLYEISLRPKWLFFLLNPIVVVAGFLYRPGYAMLALLVLFASVFILAIIGMIFSGIVQAKRDKISQKNFDAKYHVPKRSKLKDLGAIFAILIALGLGYWMYVEGKLSLLLLIIPLLIILDAIFLPTKRTNFYKLQAVLPTSKMNAVAMGLVEVIGDLVQTETLISPHFNTPCIGYALHVEERRQDNEGKVTWSTILRTSKTGFFKIKDVSGAVMVNGEGLEYYFTRVDKEIESAGKRYSETYLKDDDYLFLIGKASSKDGETIIERDDYHKVFGAALPHEVALKNKFAPLYKSFLTTLFFITLLIIYIIIT